MAQCLRYIQIVIEARPILPIAPKFGYSRSLILVYLEGNYIVCRTSLYTVQQLMEYLEVPVM
jgi:hypothetical protein